MDRGHAVGAVRADDGQMGHPDSLLGALLDEADAPDAILVAGIARTHVVQEAAVHLVDDLEVPGQADLEEGDRPGLERLGQQRVVGVGQGPDGQVPRFVPAQPGLIEQDAHQLGDGQRRVGVVELDRDLVGQRLPVVAAAAEPRDDIGQRAGDQEILLDEPQAFAAGRRVVGVEDPRERLGRDLLVDGVEEVAAAELQEVEVLMCRRAPEPQRVDGPAAVADDRPVVRRADQGRRHVPDHFEPAVLQLEGAVQANLHGLSRPHDLPGVGTSEPVVGVLDLPAAGDLLAEDAVLVPQAVADRGDLERRHRVEEAGGEPAQAAVAQSGVGLRLDELRPVELLSLHRLPHDRLDPEVEDVVGQRPADQELHREVVDLLGVSPIIGRVRLQPALRQQVAEGPGHGLETLARSDCSGRTTWSRTSRRS